MAKSIEYELKVTDAGASAAMDRFAKRASQPIVREVFIKESERAAAIAKTQILSENRAQAAMARGRTGADDVELKDMAGYYRQAAVEADKLYAIEQKRAAIMAAADKRHAASGMSQAERDATAAELRRMRRTADQYNVNERVRQRLYGDAGESDTQPGQDGGGGSGPAEGKNGGVMDELKHFRHSAAVVGMEYLGRRVAETTKAVADLRKEYDQLGAAGAAQKVLETLPIVGGWAEAGRHIRELLTGEQEQIDNIIAGTRIANALWDARVRLIRDSKQAMEEHADIVRDLYDQRVNANLSEPSASREAEFQKMEHERLVAVRKVENSRGASKTAADDPVLKEAEEKISEFNRRIGEAKAEADAIQVRKKAGDIVGAELPAKLKEIADLEKLAAPFQAAKKLRQDMYQKAIDDEKNAQKELEDLDDTQTERKLRLERDAADQMKQMDAEEAADRYRSMGQQAEAELELLKETQRKKADAYSRDKDTGVDGTSLELRRKEMENADRRVEYGEKAVAEARKEREQKAEDEQKAYDARNAQYSIDQQKSYLEAAEKWNRGDKAVADRIREIVPKDLGAQSMMQGWVGAGETQALTDAQQAKQSIDAVAKILTDSMEYLKKMERALNDQNRPVVKFGR